MSLFLCGAGMALIGTLLLTHAQESESKKRFPQLTMEQLTDERRRLAEEMLLNAAQETVPAGQTPPLEPLRDR